MDAAIEYIDSQCANEEKPCKSTIVFLGDLFDRFEYGFDVVIRVLDLIISRPGKILWLAGNHDMASFDGDHFKPASEPSNFIGWLNDQKDEETVEFGKWLFELCHRLPAALFLPDGLLVAHGGIPAKSLFDKEIVNRISSVDDLNTEEYLGYFIKNRITQDDNSERQEVKKRDFPIFFKKMADIAGISVKRMLCGHNNCQNHMRFCDYPFYRPEVEILGIHTISAWYLGDGSGRMGYGCELVKSLRKQKITRPAIAKYRYDKIPEVVWLDIPENIVAQFHKLEEIK